MRIAAVSDLHGHLPDVPPCDVLLLAGDLCPLADHRPARQAAWLDGPFRAWLDAVPAAHVVGVAGNHDKVFETHPGLVPAGLRWTYLQDSGATVAGLRVWGSPWQPVFYDWAFNAGPDKRAAAWALIPADTQVLVLHGPPHGAGDLAPRRPGPADRDDTGWPESERVGCEHLRRRLDELPELRLAVYGHIHRGRGAYPRGGRLYANVSLVDESYDPVHPVAVWDVADPAARDWGLTTLGGSP